MKVLKSLAVSTLLMFAAPCAFAQGIDDDTKCEALEALSQAPSGGGGRLKEAAGYIQETMRALDRLHGHKGKAEILTQMTDDGRSSLVQTVVSHCHERQAVTIADTAIETYEAARADLSLGSAKSARQPVRNRYSRIAAQRQPRPE